MEEEGTVSLWLGEAVSADAFWKALEVELSEDGDFLGSDFGRAFGIEYYEDALREAEFYDSPPSTLAEFVRGASYEAVVLPRLEALGLPVKPGANCLILLYNYRHTQPSVARLTGVSLSFVGAVAYM